MKTRLKNFIKILGLVIILISGALAVNKQIKKQTYLSAEAEVIDIKELKEYGFDNELEDFDETLGFAPVLSFSIEGEEYEVKSKNYETVNGESPYEVGDFVKIYVSPDNPKDFFISSIRAEIVFPLIGIFLGLIFFLIGRKNFKKIKIDTPNNFETSIYAHWSIKYSLPIIGIYLLQVGYRSENFNIGIISLEGYETLDLIFKYTLIILGIVAFILFFVFRKRFSILKFSNKKILIRKYKKPKVRKINKDERKVEWTIKKEDTLNWEDIKSIKLFYYFYPPTYAVSLKDSRKRYLFTTRDKKPGEEFRENPLNKFISFKKVKDESMLGDFIANKKVELNL